MGEEVEDWRKEEEIGVHFVGGWGFMESASLGQNEDVFISPSGLWYFDLVLRRVRPPRIPHGLIQAFRCIKPFHAEANIAVDI